MWSVFRRNPLAVLLAVVLHAALAVMLLMEWAERPPKPATGKPDVVRATVIDQRQLDQAAEKKQLEEAQIKAAEEAKKRKQQEKSEALKRKKAEEKKRQVRLEKERKEKARMEAQRKAEARAKREAVAKRKAEARAKREAEDKRKAEEKKRKAEQEKKRLAEEKRRQAETEKKRKAEQVKRKAAAERKAAKARAQAAREAQLRAAMEAEQRAGEIDRYRVAIQQGIERNWIRPPNSGNLKCTLEVRLIPGGDVISVRVTKGSGNAAFDRSVESAVRRAAPLPVPGGGLFEQFRTLNFVFDPSRG